MDVAVGVSLGVWVLVGVWWPGRRRAAASDVLAAVKVSRGVRVEVVVAVGGRNPPHRRAQRRWRRWSKASSTPATPATTAGSMLVLPALDEEAGGASGRPCWTRSRAGPCSRCCCCSCRRSRPNANRTGLGTPGNGPRCRGRRGPWWSGDVVAGDEVGAVLGLGRQGDGVALAAGGGGEMRGAQRRVGCVAGVLEAEVVVGDSMARCPRRPGVAFRLETLTRGTPRFLV